MGICGSLMDIFDYPQARSAIKKHVFFFVMRSPCTNFASQFAIRNIGIYTYIYYNSI